MVPLVEESLKPIWPLAENDVPTVSNPLDTVRLLPPVTVVFLFSEMAVALVVPTLRTPAEAVSSRAVRSDVAACSVPPKYAFRKVNVPEPRSMALFTPGNSEVLIATAARLLSVWSAQFKQVPLLGELRVIVPAVLEIFIPAPAVKVLRLKLVPLPISNWPLVGTLLSPVPPLATVRALVKASELKVGLEVGLMPWTVSTAPAVTVKLVELNEARPLMAEVASLMVILLPTVETLPTAVPARMIAPVPALTEVTPPVPGQTWKTGAPAVETRHCPAAPATSEVSPEVPWPIRTPFWVRLAVPVPPWATVSAVVRPVRLVISEFGPAAAAPRLVRAPAIVIAPVPPEVTGKAVLSVSALKVGLEVVAKLWLMVESPVRVSVLGVVPPVIENPVAFEASVRLLTVPADTEPAETTPPAIMAPVTLILPAWAVPGVLACKSTELPPTV